MEKGPIKGALAKLDRAEKQLNELGGAMSLFLDQSIRFKYIHRPEEKKMDIVLDDYVEPPLELSVRAGEIAHNLRSTLNSLAIEMIKLNGAVPTSRAEFPIFLEAGGFPKRNDPKVRGMTQSQLDAIELLQPFKVGEPESHSLWVLHELNNMDKHRSILECNAILHGIEFHCKFPYNVTFILPPAAEAYGDGSRLYSGKPFGTISDMQVPFEDEQLKVVVHPRLLVFVEGCGPAAMRPVFDTLVHIYQVVRGKVFASPGCLDGF